MFCLLRNLGHNKISEVPSGAFINKPVFGFLYVDIQFELHFACHGRVPTAHAKRTRRLQWKMVIIFDFHDCH